MCTIERIGNDLCVMNADGDVLAVHVVNGRRIAKQKIASWAEVFTFNWADAMRLI